MGVTGYHNSPCPMPTCVGEIAETGRRGWQRVKLTAAINAQGPSWGGKTVGVRATIHESQFMMDGQLRHVQESLKMGAHEGA